MSSHLRSIWFMRSVCALAVGFCFWQAFQSAQVDGARAEASSRVVEASLVPSFHRPAHFDYTRPANLSDHVN